MKVNNLAQFNDYIENYDTKKLKGLINYLIGVLSTEISFDEILVLLNMKLELQK